MIRHPEAIVFKIKGVRTGEVCRLIVDDILNQARDWTGPETCVPVFKMSFVRPEQSEEVVWPDTMIPHDVDAIHRLLLSMNELENIQHKRNFLPNERPKPRVKKKPEPKGPFSKRGYNMDGWSECWWPYFDRPELTVEGNELGRLLKGYPFTDKSATENSRYIEMELIHRLRDRLPTIYELEKLNRNALVDALRLMATPKIQEFGRPDDFKVDQAYNENQIPNMIGMYLSRLQTLDWMIKTGRIKDRDRKIVDPTDDEASEDKYFTTYGGGGGGSYANDRDFTDDLADAEALAEELAAAQSADA